MRLDQIDWSAEVEKMIALREPPIQLPPLKPIAVRNDGCDCCYSYEEDSDSCCSSYLSCLKESCAHILELISMLFNSCWGAFAGICASNPYANLQPFVDFWRSPQGNDPVQLRAKWRADYQDLPSEVRMKAQEKFKKIHTEYESQIPRTLILTNVNDRIDQYLEIEMAVDELICQHPCDVNVIEAVESFLKKN